MNIFGILKSKKLYYLFFNCSISKSLTRIFSESNLLPITTIGTWSVFFFLILWIILTIRETDRKLSILESENTTKKPWHFLVNSTIHAFTLSNPKISFMISLWRSPLWSKSLASLHFVVGLYTPSNLLYTNLFIIELLPFFIFVIWVFFMILNYSQNSAKIILF